MEKMKIIKFLQRGVLYILPFVIFIPFMAFFYRVYIRKVSAFGCFDDCFNIVAGYFINQGKTLYSEIFFNHQMLMAYISASIQKVFDPINIFALILVHRQSLLYFSFILDAVLIARFRWVGVGFVLFYESTKFYVFGDRFLAEAFIVYPLVYLVGLLWYKLSQKKIYQFDYILTAFFVWFIVFSREPFVPVALLLYILILWGKMLPEKLISLVTFSSLSALIFINLPLSDYFFNVFKISGSTVFSYEETLKDLLGLGFFKIFAYPLYALIAAPKSYFGLLLIGLSLVFVVEVFILTIFLKKIKNVLVVILALGLSNTRYAAPGIPFYEAFHMAPWYGMFIAIVFLFIFELTQFKKLRKIVYVLGIIILFLFVYLFSPRSFLWEKIDQHTEFITNYGVYLSSGEAIRILADNRSTLFVDGFDELIHWQAKVPSSYKYSWYTSVMPRISKYVDARTEMFNKNPPDFYYGSCPKEKNSFRFLPKSQKSMYTRLYMHGKPSCLHIRTGKLDEISKEQWEKVEQFGYHLPEKKS